MQVERLPRSRRRGGRSQGLERENDPAGSPAGIREATKRPCQWEEKATREQKRSSGKKGYEVNDRILVREVRLIAADGSQLGIKPTPEAVQLAQESSLDLVLVAPEADPPVARIMDFGKFKYEQKKRTHQAHRHQSQLKELRLRPKTEVHDTEVRLKQARRFLERGDRVMVTMLFRGREMAHTDLGVEILRQFAEQLADVAKVEREPKMEHRRMSIILCPK